MSSCGPIATLLLLAVLNVVGEGTAVKCPNKTGGTCYILGCDDARHAQCVDSLCVCVNGTCPSAGICVKPVEPQWCNKDTGGSCSFWGCKKWRNSKCNAESRCACAEGQCSVKGQCMPVLEAAARREVCSRDTGTTCHNSGDCDSGSCVKGHCLCNYGDCYRNGECSSAKSTAVVLAGDGTRGVFLAGLLAGICKHQSSLKDSWSLISGVQTGALQGTLLAHYPQHKQCELGVPSLLKIWKALKISQDLYESVGSVSGRAKCFDNADPVTWLSALSHFWTHGGFCDPTPIHNLIDFEISPSRVRASGMGLRVPAMSVENTEVRWWNEKSDSIREGVKASMATTPYIPPYNISGKWYMDGVFRTGVPVQRALAAGVKRVIVLSATSRHPSTLKNVTNFSKAKQNLGWKVLGFEVSLIAHNFFVREEIRKACIDYPTAEILGYLPGVDLGASFNYSEKVVDYLYKLGMETAKKAPPSDLCKLFNFSRKPSGGDYGEDDDDDDDAVQEAGVVLLPRGKDLQTVLLLSVLTGAVGFLVGATLLRRLSPV